MTTTGINWAHIGLVSTKTSYVCVWGAQMTINTWDIAEIDLCKANAVWHSFIIKK